MDIPNEIKIGAMNYKIKFVPSKEIQDNIGYCDTNRGEILINNNEMFSKEKIDQTIIHELTHSILAEMNMLDLHSDENFVNTFSLLLHQVVLQLLEPNNGNNIKDSEIYKGLIDGE